MRQRIPCERTLIFPLSTRVSAGTSGKIRMSFCDTIYDTTKVWHPLRVRHSGCPPRRISGGRDVRSAFDDSLSVAGRGARHIADHVRAWPAGRQDPGVCRLARHLSAGESCCQNANGNQKSQVFRPLSMQFRAKSNAADFSSVVMRPFSFFKYLTAPGCPADTAMLIRACAFTTSFSTLSPARTSGQCWSAQKGHPARLPCGTIQLRYRSP